ncbi:MAG: hypothetical protein BRC25_02710 [Parcubacteria group bacterium SW_6_46_9]|nr:MAG: hypothetical protein BRC25_02710 [Parcubacteria group bacterium SW_6_46_9]
MQGLKNDFAAEEMKFVVAREGNNRPALFTAECKEGSNKVKHRELTSEKAILGGARMQIRPRKNKENEKYLFVFGASKDFGLPPKEKMQKIVLEVAKEYSELTLVSFRAHDKEEPEWWVREKDTTEWSRYESS